MIRRRSPAPALRVAVGRRRGATSTAAVVGAHDAGFHALVGSRGSRWSTRILSGGIANSLCGRCLPRCRQPDRLAKLRPRPGLATEFRTRSRAWRRHRPRAGRGPSQKRCRHGRRRAAVPRARAGSAPCPAKAFRDSAPEALIEDACASAWVIACSKRDRIPEENPVGWLVVVARNEALALLRKRSNEHYSDAPIDLARIAGEPARSFATREALEQLAKLRPNQRLALSLQVAGSATKRSLSSPARATPGPTGTSQRAAPSSADWRHSHRRASNAGLSAHVRPTSM